MRRILFGGFALALGALTPSAFAQQPASAPPARAATFGRPVALPPPSTPRAFNATAPDDSNVTPAGLIRGGPAQPGISYAPVSTGVPTVLPQPGQPQPMGSDTQPKTQPMVTESRDPAGRIPNGTIIPNGTVIPSVCPGDYGYGCPTPRVESPLWTRSPMDRVRGLGTGRNWVTAELLLWWNNSTQFPPLVTTSSPQFNGILGQGDTRVLLGGGSFGDTFHVGGRVGGGHWFDDCQNNGFDWRLFWVAPASETFSATVPPFGLLARPFNNVNPTITTPGVGLGQSAEVVAGPGVANGGVVATLKNTVWGAEANYRRHIYGTECARLDFLVGYRYLDVREQLNITESFTRVPGSDPTIGVPAVMGVVTDEFRAENHFHGGQIGFSAYRQRGRWSVDLRGSIAFGTVFQSAEINGGQTLTFADGTMATTPGGLLAVPGANIGSWSQSKFAVVPEFGVNFGYQVTSNLRVFVGYNLLYLSSAIRPAGTIDPNLDAARIPNFLPPGSGAPVLPVRPMPRFDTSGYTLQGIQFGVTYRW